MPVKSTILCHAPDMLSSCDGTQDAGLLGVVLDALPGHEGGSTVRELNDDGALDVPGGLENRVDGGGGGAVEGWQGMTIISAILEELHQVLAGQNASGNDSFKTHCDK
jgi:hypothetical protein